ncbi:hypothetical protein GCM10027446_33520 [Angustibacter peucedani]
MRAGAHDERHGRAAHHVGPLEAVGEVGTRQLVAGHGPIVAVTTDGRREGTGPAASRVGQMGENGQRVDRSLGDLVL